MFKKKFECFSFCFVDCFLNGEFSEVLDKLAIWYYIMKDTAALLEL